MRETHAPASPASRVVPDPGESLTRSLLDHVNTTSPRQARIRFSLLAVFVFITTVCVALGWWYRRYDYVAKARIQIKYWDAGDTSARQYDVFHETQRALMKSALVLNATLARREIMNLDCIASKEDPELWLQTELEVAFPDNSEIMEITLAGREVDMPEYCRLIDAIIDSYKTEILYKERIEREELREAQVKSAKRIGEELKDKVEKLNDLIRKRASDGEGESADVVLLRAENEALTEAWKELHSQMLKERFDENRLRSHYRVLQSATASRE